MLLVKLQRQRSQEPRNAPLLPDPEPNLIANPSREITAWTATNLHRAALAVKHNRVLVLVGLRWPSVEKMASLNSCDLEPQTSLRRRVRFSADAVSALAAVISRSIAARTDVGIMGEDDLPRSVARSSSFSFFRALSVDRLIASKSDVGFDLSDKTRVFKLLDSLDPCLVELPGLKRLVLGVEGLELGAKVFHLLDSHNALSVQTHASLVGVGCAGCTLGFLDFALQLGLFVIQRLDRVLRRSHLRLQLAHFLDERRVGKTFLY
ncbi:hypothetical protein HG531_003742 [Fusarium graminearum]|nr:hypothetical protein HG531_003742 [Fusarium graminearum]